MTWYDKLNSLIPLPVWIQVGTLCTIIWISFLFVYAINYNKLKILTKKPNRILLQITIPLLFFIYFIAWYFLEPGSNKHMKDGNSSSTYKIDTDSNVGDQDRLNKKYWKDTPRAGELLPTENEP